MHKALHPRDDVDRQYVSRNEGGRGLTSIEVGVGVSIKRFKYHIDKHEGGLITAIRNDTDNTMDNAMTTRKLKCEEKQLYGRFKPLINNISHEKTVTWIRKENCMRETEFLLIVSQNIAVRINHIKAKIDKTQQNRKYSLWGDRDETINQMISECSKLAQKEDKTTHDWVGKVIHWEMCKKFRIGHTSKWYMHKPVSVQKMTHSFGTLTYRRIT